MRLLGRIRQLFQPRERDSTEELAQLLLAARDDEAFRQQLIGWLRAPAWQRQSLLHTALHEMELRGEPPSVRSAFVRLATDEGAKTALAILSAP